MSTHSRSGRPTTLSLPPEELWTLHHVLLHRIEQEQTANDASGIEPPPIEVFQAFDALDGGESRFTVAQLEATRDVLASHHPSSDCWEVERPRVERLLRRVSTVLETVPPEPI
jgi:hypothetical protein